MGDIHNGIIEDASIEIEDHNLLTLWLQVKLAGGTQGFGGHAIEPYAGRCIRRILEVVGVNKWSELIGKPIRVCSSLEKIYGIGHIVETEWFYPGDEIDEWLNKEK